MVEIQPSFEVMTRAEYEHLREFECCVECGQTMSILQIF